MDHLFEEISARVNDLLLDQGLSVTMVAMVHFLQFSTLFANFMGFIIMLSILS